jgi:hypothetical protein
LFCYLVHWSLTLISSYSPVARTTSRRRPACGDDRSPWWWTAFSTSGWKEKGGIRTFNKSRIDRLLHLQSVTNDATSVSVVVLL